jgi:hypothetical protein
VRRPVLIAMRAPASILVLLGCASACTALKKGDDPEWEPAPPEEGGAMVRIPAQRSGGPHLPTGTPAPSPPAEAAAALPPDAGDGEVAPEPLPEPPAADGGTSDLACPAAATENLGQPCGACGGTLTCAGCSRPTPPDYGKLKVDWVEVLEKTGSRSSRAGERIGRQCPPGHEAGACSVEVTRTGSDSPLAAGCFVVSEGRSCHCRVRWWADDDTTLRCTVIVQVRRTCDR